MQLILYAVFCRFYKWGILLASPFNDKAKQWISGRKNWKKNQKLITLKGNHCIWIHCSSLGEFEQGRPLIEKLKQVYPNYKIVLTFFSPSGYEIQKNYPLADLVMYMPMDSPTHAKKFIEAIQPALAVFVKYEFWYYYLNQLHLQQIPTIIISAAFRENQLFFKWYGTFFRKMLHCFNYIFVQNEHSKKLLATIGITNNVIISGDTRYDRVAEIAQKTKRFDIVENFKGNGNIFIAGSTWQDDEALLSRFFTHLPTNWKLIIAPHEIHKAHIDEIQKLFGNNSVLFSEIKCGIKANEQRVLIIDNIGMLSSLYAYGDMAFVGGGFQKSGIHNILEPAIYGLPIFFGPVYKKFVEANTLVELGYAYPVNNPKELQSIFIKYISDENYSLSKKIGLIDFMKQSIGATTLVMECIKSLFANNEEELQAK